MKSIYSMYIIEQFATADRVEEIDSRPKIRFTLSTNAVPMDQGDLVKGIDKKIQPVTPIVDF